MVKVIVKAFDILELVARQKGHAISLTEVAQQLELNQATTANIISSLVAKEYLEHIGKKKGYRLGPAAYNLTSQVTYGQNLVSAAQDIMEQLLQQLNETCLLGVMRNNKRYILHIINTTQEIQVQTTNERSIYATASGRVLLAYLTTKELERFIQQNNLPDEENWKGASTFEGLQSELEKIRADGMVITYLSNRHVKGFAVPIYEHQQVVAGLSVFLPEYRCSEAIQIVIIQLLKEAGLAISKKLGYKAGE
jgi:DNA-binding IclR family transcriptional regulator